MTNRRNNASGVSVFSSHTYTFDALSRRETAAREDTTKWDYDYNDRSEVSAGKKLLSSGAPLAGTVSTYNYDAIGNRLTATSGGGPATGSGSPADVGRSVTYVPNALNQYTAITQDQRSFDVIGRYSTATASSPTVNSTVPYDQVVSSVTAGTVVTEQRQFRSSITAASSGNTAGNYENVNVQTSAGTVLEASGLKWVPGTTVVPQYDHDGNLTQNGRWTYTWDAENRLIGAVRAASTSPAVAQMKVEFTYDGLSRRTEKKVSTLVVSAWVETLRERTLYDGWNPIGTWRLQPADASHASPWWKLHQHYVWGPDVSGTAQGAGGVGGLAFIYDPGQLSGGWFPCYDGNGNVTALVSATTNGATAALYDYDAFGKPTRLSGPAAKLNPFRFSTKFTDDETELVYYGYRYYEPAIGRWLNKDPIGERGGLSVYSFFNNDLLDRIDGLGLEPIPPLHGLVPNAPKLYAELAETAQSTRAHLITT